MAKPGVQRRIANLTEAPKECSGSSSSGAMSAADSRISIRSSSDLEEGVAMHSSADFAVGGLEDGNIPTFLMDQLGPSTTNSTPIPQPEKRVEQANFGGGAGQVVPMEPQVKMNFTITSNDIVEMKIEPDVVLAGANTAISDEKKKNKEKRSLPADGFKTRTTEEPSNHCVPPKKRRHDLNAEGSNGSGTY